MESSNNCPSFSSVVQENFWLNIKPYLTFSLKAPNQCWPIIASLFLYNSILSEGWSLEARGRSETEGWSLPGTVNGSGGIA